MLKSLRLLGLVIVSDRSWPAHSAELSFRLLCSRRSLRVIVLGDSSFDKISDGRISSIRLRDQSATGALGLAAPASMNFSGGCEGIAIAQSPTGGSDRIGIDPARGPALCECVYALHHAVIIEVLDELSATG